MRETRGGEEAASGRGEGRSDLCGRRGTEGGRDPGVEGRGGRVSGGKERIGGRTKEGRGVEG